DPCRSRQGPAVASRCRWRWLRRPARFRRCSRSCRPCRPLRWWQRYYRRRQTTPWRRRTWQPWHRRPARAGVRWHRPAHRRRGRRRCAACRTGWAWAQLLGRHALGRLRRGLVRRVGRVEHACELVLAGVRLGRGIAV
ncbi:hypothetical protein XPN_1691, partial [Xanthomonas arboricola pv. pruni MAFF 301427]